MSALRQFLLLASLLVLAMPMWAVPVDFPANPESARRGITMIRIEREGKTLDIDIMGVHKQIARLLVEFDTPEGSILSLRKDKAWLRISWDQQRGRVTVMEPSTRQSASRTVSLAPKKQMTTEGDGSLFDKHLSEIELAFTVYDQALVDIGLYEFFRKQTPTAKDTEHKLILRCPPSCDGPLIQTIALASGLTRCCAIATNDANVLCSNGLCLGCCQILGCDSACAIGDGFACVCAVLGQACSAPVLECDDQWPPECT